MDKRLAAARVIAAQRMPYLASALWALLPVEKPIGTLAVSEKYVLYYDPDALNRWSVEEVAGVLIHEVFHLLNEHHRRCREAGHEPRRANVAQDLAINTIIRQEVSLPEGGLLPSQFNLPEKQTYEWYYDKLPEEKDYSADCGSCSDGQPRDYEDEGNSGGGLSGAEAAVIRRQVAREIQAAAAVGHVPAELVRWAEENISPRVKWDRILARYLRNSVGQASGMVDYTYRRPSRRRVEGVVLPSLYAPRPNVTVIVDTSGSMEGSDLGKALAEIGAITKTMGCSVTVVSGDTEAHTKAMNVTSAKQVKLVGGGGTDMVKIISQVESSRPKPSVIVVITDGLCDWDAPPPRVPVVIVLTGKSTLRPKWSHVVEIK